MRKLLIFLVVCLLSLGALLPVGAADVHVIDRANLLSGNTAAVENAIEKMPENVSFYLMTGTQSTYPSDSEVHSSCGIAGDDAAVVLYVRLSGGVYYYDIYTFGDADSMFSNSQIDRILDDPDVFDNIKGGNMSAGAARFFALAGERCVKYQRARVPKAILWGVIIGALTGGGAVLIVALCYRRKQRGESYPLDRYASLDLQVRQDRFIGSTVTKVRVQSSNSGSSGGSRGGGGFSGGHRGGR